MSVASAEISQLHLPLAIVDSHTLVGRIKAKARSLGFDLVGIAAAEPSVNADYLRRWLDDGNAGQMQYLHGRFEERTNPANYFPGARSIICLAKSYHFPLQSQASAESNAAIPGRIARYALGDDYHQLIKDRLYDLADWLREHVPGCQTRCGVDTVPVLEKELAARAGIGWIGKNTLLINPQLGSYILLGEVLTTLQLPADATITDHCGACRRCIDACPTQALVGPRQLDARRCISYLTIEHRTGPIPDHLQPAMGDWLYGCDICQQVCPWNQAVPTSDDPAMQPRFAAGSLDAAELMNWTVSDYQQRLRNSAMKRVKLPVLQRNAEIVLRNAEIVLRNAEIVLRNAGSVRAVDGVCATAEAAGKTI
jgi:epoxyqueuosine reductase